MVQTLISKPLSDAESADIVFLVHASKKTNTKDFKKKLIPFITNIAEKGYEKSQFALVVYGDTVETMFKLTMFKTRPQIRK